MDKMMKALRFHPDTKEFSLDEIPVPKLNDEDNVLVKVAAAGFCGTDLHIMAGEFSPACPYTITLGHEFVGTVEAVGDGVKKFKPGDRVAVDPSWYCNACNFCQRGESNFCNNGGVRGGIGTWRNGAFAKYCAVPDRLITPLPDSLPFNRGALCEPLSCILHGWELFQKYGPVKQDARILILGAGIIGNLWACVLHHFGFRNVTISELSEKRRKIAERMGTGFKVLSVDETTAAMPKDQDDAQLNGVGVLLDCSGSPAALSNAFKWTKRGAMVCVFGCPPVNRPMSICPEEIFSKELVMFGVLSNPYSMARAVPMAANMSDNYLDLDKLGVATFKLEDFKKAMERLKTAEISKAVFEF